MKSNCAYTSTMSATLSQRAAKGYSAFAEKIRNASITTKGFELEHGREIYAHSHLQTNQVVYSLQKHMKVYLDS